MLTMIGRTSWLPHPPTKHPPDKSQLLHIVPAPPSSILPGNMIVMAMMVMMSNKGVWECVTRPQ